MRKLSPIILALALSPLVQAEPVSEVSPVGKIDGMVSLPVTGMKAVESNGRIGNLEQDDACNLEPMQGRHSRTN